MGVHICQYSVSVITDHISMISQYISCFLLQVQSGLEEDDEGNTKTQTSDDACKIKILVDYKHQYDTAVTRA